MVFGEDIPVSAVENLIIKSKTMQRMRCIDQSGPSKYFWGGAVPAFSRFDHSIGVWALVKKFSQSELECYAALLHDSSFPAFSHMTDFLISSLKEDGVVDQNNCFQDRTHVEYLKKSEIYKLLNKNLGISIEQLDFKNKSYSCLEQDLPDMCADRIEYNIHTALLMRKITMDQAKEMIASLRFANGKWFFTDALVARNFAELSLFFTQNFWSTKFNFVVNFHFAEAVRIAIKKKLLDIKDIYLTDLEF
jgi:HD superfamily phosphohydrolase